MIECEALELSPGGRTLTATVPAGEFVWLSGSSGAGKTTLLRRFGAREPLGNARRVRVLGVELGRAGSRERARLRRRIGFLDEDPPVLGSFTVLENIALPLRVRGVRAARAAAEAADLADWLGIGALLDRDAARLSTGERRLCAVARAVAGRPALVLADEPGSGLDDATAAKVVLLLVELAALGSTVLASTRSPPARRPHAAPELSLDRSPHPDRSGPDPRRRVTVATPDPGAFATGAAGHDPARRRELAELCVR